MVNVGSAFVADSEPPETIEPRKSPLYYPAVTTESLAALHAPSGDPDLDASPVQESPAAWVVVPLVGVELAGSFARSSSSTLNRFDRVHDLLKEFRVVDVCGRDSSRERNASPVEKQVVLGAGSATIYRVGTGGLAPLFAGMLAESTEALDQSMHPARPSLSRKTFRSRLQTPVVCQSRSLRQQVTPLPQPSFFGSMPHGMPVFST